MPKLTVKDFGCIEYAEIELSRLTVIIGPQSSGKSLLSKLIYFCSELLQGPFSEEVQTIERFRVHTERKFSEWFPLSAWGKKRFTIQYTAGPFSFTFTRYLSSRPSSNKVRFATSDAFASQYTASADILRNAYTQLRDETVPERRASFEVYWKIRFEEERRVSSLLGQDAIDYQLYIPAGRAFFLNVEKAYASVRESHALDPITNQFGQYFALARSRLERQGRISPDEVSREIAALSHRLLGGDLEYQKESLVLAAADGRVLPVSILSSGQQELLPLWMMINFFGPVPNVLVYIEEPEAHLFPASQSLLTEFLVRNLNSHPYGPVKNSNNKMLVTTHSPYILSKINNLLKAGSLAVGRAKEVRSRISTVIPSDVWLAPGSTSAYAICDGRTKSLIEEDGGLIDSAYLDGISSEIVEEFSNLQDIELELIQ